MLRILSEGLPCRLQRGKGEKKGKATKGTKGKKSESLFSPALTNNQ